MLGRAGFAARGFVFLLVGAFLSMAAWYYEPQQAVGVAGALRSLQDKPYGTALLGLAAIGLACFGLFELAQAARRRRAALPTDHSQCNGRGFVLRPRVRQANSGAMGSLRTRRDGALRRVKGCKALRLARECDTQNHRRCSDQLELHRCSRHSTRGQNTV
jgi:type VI protein secretion system component VasK